jgi:hypothetical protein
MEHAYNSSNWEAEAGGLQVQGQPKLPSQTLFQNKKQTTQDKIKENNKKAQTYY